MSCDYKTLVLKHSLHQLIVKNISNRMVKITNITKFMKMLT